MVASSRECTGALLELGRSQTGMIRIDSLLRIRIRFSRVLANVSDSDKHPMGSAAAAGLKMTIFTSTFPRAILTRKVGQTQTGIVFGVRSGLIGVAVRARLQVSVYAAAATICATLVDIHRH